VTYRLRLARADEAPALIIDAGAGQAPAGTFVEVPWNAP
jgi:hypothetical protein